MPDDNYTFPSRCLTKECYQYSGPIRPAVFSETEPVAEPVEPCGRRLRRPRSCGKRSAVFRNSGRIHRLLRRRAVLSASTAFRGVLRVGRRRDRRTSIILRSRFNRPSRLTAGERPSTTWTRFRLRPHVPSRSVRRRCKHKASRSGVSPLSHAALQRPELAVWEDTWLLSP